MTIQMPEELLIRGFDDPLEAIVESTYPNLLENINDPSVFQKM
jgi:hypothetical protein